MTGLIVAFRNFANAHKTRPEIAISHVGACVFRIRTSLDRLMLIKAIYIAVVKADVTSLCL
jgi:hypothetical protein